MADTSLLFDLLGRDRLSKVFLAVRKSGVETADALERIGGNGTVRGNLDQVAAGVGNLWLQMAKIPAVVHGVTAVGAAVGSLAPAMAVLPAAGVAVGIGFGVAKIGVEGFADAMAETDPTAFAEAVGELAPNARAAAVAARALAPAWTDVKRAVQNEIFTDVAASIQQVGSRYLPILKTGLTDVAGGFRAAVLGARDFALQAQTQRDVSTIFGQTADVVGDVSSALNPLLRILRDVVAVGMDFLPGFSSGFADAAESAADFVEQARQTGQLREWISGGLSAIGDLITLLGNVGRIIGQVFGAFTAEGAGVLSTAIAITDAIAEFLSTVEGQAALGALADAMLTVSQVGGAVFLTVLRELAPVVIQLAPAVAELATQVGAALVAALQVAGPLLSAAAGFLAENVAWLGPMAIALYALIKAFEALIVVVKILNILMAMNPYVLIIMATIAVVALIITYWDEIVSFLSGVWDTIRSVAQTVWSAITGAVEDAIDGVESAISWLAGLPGKIGTWFAELGRAAGARLGELVTWFTQLPGRILTALVALPGQLWGLFTSALGFALRAVVDGLHWIIVQSVVLPFRIIGALIDLGQLLWDLFTAALAYAAEAVVTGVTAVVTWVAGLPQRIIDSVIALGALLAAWAKQAWDWARTTVVEGATAIVRWVSELPGRTIAAVSSLGRRLWEWAVGAFRSARDGAVQTASELIDWVSGLPGRILSAIGNFAQLLYNSGRDLLRGLIDGIVSMVKGVIDRVVQIGRDILSGIQGALGIASPSKEMHKIGVWAGKGLIAGLDAMIDPVTAVVADLAAAAMPTLSAIVIPEPRTPDSAPPPFGPPAGGSPGFGGGSGEHGSTGHRGGGGGGPMVHIEHYHPPADAPVDKVAAELHWMMRGGGK